MASDHASRGKGPLHNQLAELASGTTTSVELTRRTFTEIDATTTTLNCFRHLRREAAFSEAAEADALRRDDPAGAKARPLLGVPIAIKDDTDIAGLPTHFGCGGDVEPRDHDSDLVKRLKASGAIIVGKTNTPELGQWPMTDGPAFGYTRNPWNRDQTPGGSSGGSAAAVSAGIVAAAIGSDGAGSVRIPASWTNLVGLKTERGRISMAPDTEWFHGITVHGPLARTISDAALLLSVLTTDPEFDPIKAVATTPGPLRIGLAFNVPFSGFFHRITDDVREATNSIAGSLRALGHEVIPIRIPYRIDSGLQFLPRSLGGLHEWVDRVPGLTPQDHRTVHNIRVGRLLTGAPLHASRSAEAILAKRIGKLYNTFDVLLSPTTATGPAPLRALDGAGDVRTDQIITRHCPMTWPWNVLGWPALNVPAGFGSDGSPIGAQLMGTTGQEELLLSIGAQLEDVRRWYTSTPNRWW